MSGTTLEQIGAILGYCAAAITLAVYVMKTPKVLQIVLCVATMFAIGSYAFLGVWTGCILNVICLIRSIVYILAMDHPFFKKKFWTWIFVALMIVMGIITWQNWSSILSISALVVNTIFLSLEDNQKLRYSVFYSATVLITYDIINKAYGLCILEAIALISAIIGLIMYSPRRKKKAAESNETETIEDNEETL